MDDVLVIILTLVFTVIAAVGQMKKKKQQMVTREDDGTPDFWDVVLHEDQPAPYPAPPMEGQAPKPVTRPSRKGKQKIAQQPQPVMPDEGGRIVRSVKTTVGPQNITPTPSSETMADLKDFSLRKAIIYSEILNPKYF